MPSWKKVIVSGSDASLNSLTVTGNTIITGSLAVGTSSIGPSENTITLGARDNGSEGAQLGFNAPGGTYTSASFIDLYQNRLRILKGTNAGSVGEVAWWNMHNLQMALPGYSSISSFPGTAAGYLAFDATGNVITVAAGNPFPYTGSAQITGSLAVTGSLTVTAGITGSLQGTSSYAIYAATASYSTNASDILIYVKNTTGTQINKGNVVRITGATGDNALIATASYEDDSVSANTLGITNENIANDAFGYVITEGTLIGINTNGWTAGQLLFLGANGSITGSAPLAPLHAVRLGQVLRVQTNNGSMYVRIDNGYELNELHDVTDNTTTASYGDLLVKSGSVWTNSNQLTGSYALTGSLTITGSTSSDLVRITQTGTGNVFVVEDSTNPDSTPFLIDNVGNTMIGTTSSYGLLTVKGAGVNGVVLDTDTISTTQSTRLFFKNSGSNNDVSLRGYQGGLILGIQASANTTSGTSAFFVSQSGDIGIGPGFAPSGNRVAALQVSGNISIEAGFAYKQDGQNVIYIAKGADSFYANTVGGANAGTVGSYRQTVYGYTAGNSQTGSNQTAIGFYAGRQQTGSNQTAVGTYAGYLNSGSSQTAIGVNAGYLNSGSNQTVIGFQAGYLNSGTNQTTIGTNSGFQNSGSSQTAIGVNAGQYNSGSNQTAIGTNAGLTNTGSDQTAVGVNAGYVNSATNQTAIGTNAGYANLGIEQTAIGVYAGSRNIGSNQTAVGFQSGRLNTGSFQTAVGYNAGLSNAVDYQIAIGGYAGYLNTGSNQTAIGYYAGAYNSGSDNTNIGHLAGHYITGTTGINSQSLQSVFLGSSTKAGGTNRTNQIVIGYNAIGIGSNSVVLGNDSITTTALKGFVGIGITTPTASLHVTNTTTSASLLIEDSTNPDTSPFIVDSAGNVGIGTPTPGYKLSILDTGGDCVRINVADDTKFNRIFFQKPSQMWSVGSIANTNDFVIADETAVSYPFRIYSGSKHIAINPNGTGSVSIGTQVTSTAKLHVNNTTALASFLVEDDTNPDTTPFIIDATGNVGIGTTTPTSKLHVANQNGNDLPNVITGETTNTNGRSSGLELKTNWGSTAAAASSSIIFDYYGSYFPTSSEAVYSQGLNYVSGRSGFSKHMFRDSSLNTLMMIDNTGSVGIGITTPSAKLHVTNVANNNSFLVEDSTNPDTTPFVIDKDGLVGIGTTTPSSSLTLHGSDRFITTAQTQYGWGNTNTIGVAIGTSNSGIIDFRRYTGGLPSDHGVATIEQQLIGGGWGLAFKTDQTSSNSRASSTRMYITVNGDIGIGTTTPTSKLTVAGNTLITGSLTVTNDFTVLGSSSIQYITSSQLNIADNIISVNTITPAIRFGGLAVIDSGSSPQQSGSLLFDSQNNQWIFVHQSAAGSAVTSSVLIMGPQTFDNVGNETTLTANRLTKAAGGDLGEHITNSNITDTGTVVSINSNTEVTGSLTVSGSLRVGGIIFGDGGTQLTGATSINGDTTITGSLNVTTNITSSKLLITGSTSGNLVQITQTGAGNAFVVSDSNPDSSVFVIDSTGSVGIGELSASPSAYSTKLYINAYTNGFSGINARGSYNHAIIGQGGFGYAGIYGENADTSANTNIGVYGKAYQAGDPYSGGSMIGGKFEAAGDPGFTPNYSVQLKDGTEAAGKVLVSQDASGSANWSTQLSGSYEITGSLVVTDTIKGTSSHIDMNAMIQASLLYLSNNF